MRRAAILSALFALGLFNLGCRHTAGKCDCTADPANHPMPPISNPYPVTGPTVSGSGSPLMTEITPAPIPMPNPMKETVPSTIPRALPLVK